MRLILSRHGNTFPPGRPAVWLGASDDPPLTAQGVTQAIQLAEAMDRAGILPSSVYCGPLVRMTAFADILAERLNLGAPPIVDDRLAEIDYGRWRGLSNEEIVRLFGARDFYDWYERCIWPASCWASEEGKFHASIRGFVRNMSATFGTGQTVVAVTGHGALKCLGVQIRGEPNGGLVRGWHRVDTGHICDLLCQGERIRVQSWNGMPRMILGRSLAS